MTGKKEDIGAIKSTYLDALLQNLNGQPNAAECYPDPSLSLNKYVYNAFASYLVNSHINIGLSSGGQQSQAQVAYIENLATPLSYRLSKTNYAGLNAKVYGLTAQVAMQGGKQDVCKGANGYQYDLSTVDALAEYDQLPGTFQFKTYCELS